MRPLAIAVTPTSAAGLALAATGASAEGPIATSGGPPVGFRGCIYYQHAGFQGERQSIADGTRRRYVGDPWNDQISSIACNRRAACRLTVFQHRDYGGARRTFYPNIQYVGDGWNDQISSMIAQCGDSKGAGGEWVRRRF